MEASTMAMPSPWVKFPFSHPDSFQKMLTMLDTTTILSCRAVCIDWRNWFTISQTVWASVLPRVVTRVFSRRVRMELELVWDIRLDLLLEIVDECWTEKQEMAMAIRIERAAKQSLWREFEDTLKVVSQLHQAFSRGLMSSPCVGPACIFLRSKVAHPAVLRVMGETLARHLNCVIIDEKDKEASVVRQCLLRAMISCNQAPRWVFKEFDLGWLDVEEEEEEEIAAAEMNEDEENPIDEEDSAPNKFSFSYILNSLLSLVSGLFNSVWRMTAAAAITQEPQKVCQEDSQPQVEEEDEDSLYSRAPPPVHHLFPTVLELLDCDTPWLKKLLVDKVGIDKILVVPKFEEVTSHVEKIDPKYTVAGLDHTGSVCHLDCGELARYEGAVVGYVEYPAINFNGEGKGLHFWGGRDVRGRWPVFTKVLEVMEGEGVEQDQVWSDSEVSSEEWSEKDVEEVEEDCADDSSDEEIGKGECKDEASDESQTSDLGVSPDLSINGSGDGVDDNLEVGNDGCELREEQPEIYAAIEQENSDFEEIDGCNDQDRSDGVLIDYGMKQENSDIGKADDCDRQDINDIGKMDDDFNKDDSEVEEVDDGFEQENSDSEGFEQKNGDVNGMKAVLEQ